ncbi:MAG: vitamin B12-dependent ribonucleotide reductase [Methanocellales archaeon]
MPVKIRKRDGKIVPFEMEKIASAIYRATQAINKPDRDAADRLAREVVSTLDAHFPDKVPSVEDVQDLVEKALIKHGYADAAKAYILYRKKRAEIRKLKQFLGVVDELKLSVNAVKVLKQRYLLKDETGKVIESTSGMFARVAKAVAEVDLRYKSRDEVEETKEQFYRAMVNLEFLPNSPTLMNAGTQVGQLSACFVLPVEDSLDAIFDAVKYMAVIHKSGGGTGFSFSKLRPKGDIVGSTMGVASGPVSFMRVFDIATEVVKQGGRRRGANMGVLRVDHPDILEFITAKQDERALSNFNISVGVTDSFMQTMEKGEEYELINPRNKQSVKKLSAKNVFDLIVTMAWRTGDPGIIFLDEINRHNPTPQLGEIESTNPCGELPLLPYESCNLGSINLAKMVKNGEIEWEKLRRIVKLGVHFLDNVIDANKFPMPEIEQITKANRKIGLGVMGFADMLIQLQVPYDSNEALEVAEKVMKFISEEAIKKSIEIAEEKGSFPNFKDSLWDKKGYTAIRNATLTTIAPTGTISIIAGASSGIEPLFAVSYIRDVMEGTRLLEVNPFFEEIAVKRGFYSEELMLEVAKRGSIQQIESIPWDIRRIFVTALDIAPEWHVRMQAAFQKYVDNAVAKTVNLPHDATIEDVRAVFTLAYKLQCKGITVYRYGSKKSQVLYIGSILSRELAGEEHVSAASEYSGGCPAWECHF